MLEHPSFDLSFVERRLKKETNWPDERLFAAITGYRQYLALCKATPGPHAPSRDVDEVWHAHILFTREYMRDCVAFFGHYFHHMPNDEEQPSDGPDAVNDAPTCDGRCCAACKGDLDRLLSLSEEQFEVERIIIEQAYRDAVQRYTPLLGFRPESIEVTDR